MSPNVPCSFELESPLGVVPRSVLTLVMAPPLKGSASNRVSLAGPAASWPPYVLLTSVKSCPSLLGPSCVVGGPLRSPPLLLILDLFGVCCSWWRPLLGVYGYLFHRRYALTSWLSWIPLWTSTHPKSSLVAVRSACYMLPHSIEDEYQS